MADTKSRGKLVKYCHILQWIQSVDHEFATAIKDLCMDELLIPGADVEGITFLYPSDVTYRREIVDKAYSNDADTASKMIESLIIPDLLTKSSDFMKRPIGSKLGVLYPVKGYNEYGVRLLDNVELRDTPAFTTLERCKDRVAVWTVISGKLPISGEAYTAPKPANIVRTLITEESHNRRFIATSVERDFDKCMKLNKCATNHPYLEHVIGLLNYLKKDHPDILSMIIPVCDYDPIVCFYLLFEPYKTSGDYLIPNEVLFGDNAWNCTLAYENASDDFELIMKECMTTNVPSNSRDAYIYKDRAAVSTQIDSIRQRYRSINPRNGPQFVHDAYQTLSKDNSISGMRPILPHRTHEALKHDKKLWQDEFRFITHEAIQNLLSAPYSTMSFMSLIRDINTAWPGNNYSRELRLSDLHGIKRNVAPRIELMMLAKFVNSTDFLYLPVSPLTIGPIRGSMNPNDWSIYNRNALAHRRLKSYSGIKRNGGISSQALQELRIYVRRHNQLPDEVTRMVGSNVPQLSSAPSTTTKITNMEGIPPPPGYNAL